MTRLLLTTLLLLSSAPAFAEWELLGRNNDTGLTLYADPDTIRRKGNLVKVWELRDLKTARTLSEGRLYMSLKLQKEYDCAEDRLRTLDFTYFSGQMGNGTVLDSGSDEGKWKWESVSPESIGQLIWKRVCMKQ